MTEIRLPRLLDEEMRERARLHPAAARARIRLNALSTAEVTLDEEDAPIRVRDMAELYGPQGSLGIFRVSALQAAGDGLRLAEMGHGLCTLEDDVTPPGTVLQGAIGDVVNTLLQWQSRPMWKLGTVESETVLAETEADGANLLETLLAVLAIDESLMIETDQRALPWVLHLKKMPEETGCECRLNRNLDGVTVALDGSELCTRVTAVLPDGTTVTRDGDTIGAWGVVHRAVALDENQDPETEIRKYLEEHKNPGVSVELEAVALAALTGETLDRFSLGGLCRVALPEWNTVISERVIAMAYDDLFGEPGKVKLTLCSQTLDAAALLARLRAEQRRSGRQMFRFIRETKNGVEILAEEILLRATKTEMAELNGVLTDKISEVSVELDAANAQLRLKANQEYVDQQFSATELLLDGANARIEANALRIDEVKDQISSANLAIDGANARIDAEAKRIDEANQQISSANLAIDGANARIDAEAKRIDEANEEISNANLAIDGANARIDAEAKRIDEANEEISNANLAIDGANARIDAEAKRIDEANGEISSAKLAIDGANAAITAEAKRATEAEGELTGKLEVTTEAITAEVTRATGAEEELAGRIKITEDSITEQAGKITEQGKLISGAEERIDGLNKTITDVAGDIDQLTGDLSGVRTELDGVNKTVTEQAGTIDAQGKLISGVQTRVDGIDKSIEEIAGDVDSVTGDLTGVKTRLSGAEEKLTAQAGKIDDQGKLIEGAQSEIDGLNKTITDVAGDIDQLTGDLSGVRTELDGANKKITEQAGKIDAQGEMIEGVQLVLNGEEGEAGLIARMGDAESALTVASDEIKAEVKRATEKEGEMSASIKVNADAIELRATKKEVEDVTASLKVESDRITSVVGDVDGHTEWLSAVDTVVQNHTTSIQQNAKDITLRATTDQVNAAIKVEADKITSTVSEVSDKVDGHTEWLTAMDAVVQTHTTSIQQNAKDITLRATTEEMNAAIKVEADRISSVVGTVDGHTEWLSAVDTVVQNHTTSIQQNAKDITLRATKEEMNAAIKVEADKITSTVSGHTEWLSAIDTVVVNHTSLIQQNMKEISLKVAKDNLISEINQTAETIKISASKINLEGYVTAKELQAEIADFVDTWSDNAAFGTLSVVNGNITSLSCTDITIGGSGLPDAVQESIFSKPHYHTVTESGGTVTIGGPSATAGSFNIADTKFYKDGVSAAKASVDFESFTDLVYHSDTKAYTFNIKLDNGKEHAYSHSALDAYNAGANSVYIEKITWSNPAKGYVQCNITLSNGVQRGPSYQVPSGWM